jgi:hypothetical protein
MISRMVELYRRYDAWAYGVGERAAIRLTDRLRRWLIR